MKERPGDQPLPTPNDFRDIQSMVIDDIGKRREVGIERYGTALQPFNGRKTLRDIYEELLDAACYVRQRLVEEDLIDSVIEKNEQLKERIAAYERWNEALAATFHITPASLAAEMNSRLALENKELRSMIHWQGKEDAAEAKEPSVKPGWE